MNIWNGIEAYPETAPRMAATLGNYDGVHLGHQAILRRVVETARSLKLGSLLITFSPHPMTVVAPQRRLQRLQTRRQRLESLQREGLTDLLIIHFNAGLASLSGEAFFENVLDGRVSFGEIFVGQNFRFGHNREGHVGLLQRLGASRGFEVGVVPPVQLDGATVSSSAIRQAVGDGDVALARRMLGRPFSVVGEVIPGDGRGRELHCPTANLDLEDQILPRPGVYITETSALASRFGSVTNVGVRPTFGEERLVVETHLLDFDEDLYQERVSVRFLARLRDEARFESVSDLADQIARDCAAAESFFQNQRLSDR